MKKFFFLLLTIFFSINLSSKEKLSLSLRVLYPYTEDISNEYEDSIVKLYFDVSEKALYLKIYNKTKNRMYLEWENFRIDDSAIAFDTDRRLKMDEPKSDEVIFPNNSSTHNYLIPKKAIDDSSIGDWWDIDKIKKIGEQFSRIIVPIRLNDKNIDYVFHIGVACVADGQRSKVNIPTTDAIESITEGMKYEDVISSIGYPFYFTKHEKTLIAHYFNGLSVEFQTPNKGVAFVLSRFWTPNTINIGLVGRNKTKVTKVDKSNIQTITPEQYFKELYK